MQTKRIALKKEKARYLKAKKDIDYNHISVELLDDKDFLLSMLNKKPSIEILERASDRLTKTQSFLLAFAKYFEPDDILPLIDEELQEDGAFRTKLNNTYLLYNDDRYDETDESAGYDPLKNGFEEVQLDTREPDRRNRPL
ncbi:MAG: hypothetical protein LBQ83_00155 [Candidatus Margulisbacteria bacterium]|jgi:hypothetical protein|nr:hypothetical protein [Candidatus Margulisiibacteriota bacterium]